MFIKSTGSLLLSGMSIDVKNYRLRNVIIQEIKDFAQIIENASGVCENLFLCDSILIRSMIAEDLFIKQLRECTVAIGYHPLKREPHIDFLPIPPTVILPTDPHVDPIEIAQKLYNQFFGEKVCIYIPGTIFDTSGTRYGRGGGWYDRFLATVPSEWMRIGVCFKDNISNISLERKPWDQPVDWICVKKENTIEYYKTNARTA